VDEDSAGSPGTVPEVRVFESNVPRYLVITLILVPPPPYKS